MRLPRWVVDTNVLVSALLWQGTPGQVIELAGDKEVLLFSSRALLAELAAALTKPRLAKYVAATGLAPEQMLAGYKQLARAVAARQLDTRVSRDIDDDAVLACALAARADLIVSGDEDLLVLGSFEGIDIVTPAEALRRVRSKR